MDPVWRAVWFLTPCNTTLWEHTATIRCNSITAAVSFLTDPIPRLLHSLSNCAASIPCCIYIYVWTKDTLRIPVTQFDWIFFFFCFFFFSQELPDHHGHHWTPQQDAGRHCGGATPTAWTSSPLNERGGPGPMSSSKAVARWVLSRRKDPSSVELHYGDSPVLNAHRLSTECIDFLCAVECVSQSSWETSTGSLFSLSFFFFWEIGS